MDVFRTYRIASFCTVLTGTTMYGVAEPSPETAVLAFVIAIAAWVVTGGADGERARSNVVPRWAINGAVLLATALMALAWINEAGWTLTGDMENTVSRFSRYLIWLQLIKLFEACRARDQAHLLALSTMLVVGACLTSVTLAVGMVLVVYLPLLVWTVVLFQVYASGERVHKGERAIHLRRHARRGLGGLVAGVGLATLVIGAGVFAAMPRGFGEKMLGATPQPQSDYETGFTDTVQLGAAGLITESRKIVGDAQLRDTNGTVISRRQLLRGAVLDEYDHATGRWRRSDTQDKRDFNGRAGAGDFADGQVELEVSLRSIPTQYLFTVLTPKEIRFPEDTSYMRNRLTLSYERTESDRSSIRYTVRIDNTSTPESDWEEPLGGPEGGFDSDAIRGEALRVAEDLGIDLASSDPSIRHRMASALTSHLGRTCAYTLEMESPPAGQDPIEMFLEIRRGHCEYFASALAAMCMSVGIDARVVTGFATPEFDEGEQKHIIRENHAHAWVEAEVYPGVWRSFDPSPRDAVVAAQAPKPGLLGALRRVREMIEYAWVESVVSYGETSRMSPQDALNSGVLGWLFRMRDSAGASGMINQAPRYTVAVVAQRAAVGMIAGLIAGAVCAALLVLVREPASRGWAWVRWRLWARIGGLFAGRERARVLRHEGAYYRVLDLLRRGGLEKPDWRPALAHAGVVQAESAAAGRAVRGVVEMYYAERFGGGTAPPEHEVRCDAWLGEIGAFVRERRRAKKKGPRERVG